MNEERCVCCGNIIPEGTQTCPNCYAKAYSKLPDKWLKRDVPVRPKVYKMRIGYGYNCRQCGFCVSRAMHKYCPNCGQCIDWQNTWLHEEEILKCRKTEG